MAKQKIKIFYNSSNDVNKTEKEVNEWLNNKNSIKVLNISASNHYQYGGYTVVVHYEYEENHINETISKKIPIEYYFENCEKRKLCIHCNTLEKAKKFTKALIEFKNNEIGPLTSEQIRNINCYWTEFWDNFKNETCYEKNGYCYKEWYLKNGYTIYEFEDIIFE